jgi:hypothetical protein
MNIPQLLTYIKLLEFIYRHHNVRGNIIKECDIYKDDIITCDYGPHVTEYVSTNFYKSKIQGTLRITNYNESSRKDFYHDITYNIEEGESFYKLINLFQKVQTIRTSFFDTLITLNDENLGSLSKLLHYKMILVRRVDGISTYIDIDYDNLYTNLEVISNTVAIIS